MLQLPCYAPAFKDECYSSLPAILEKDDDPLPREVLEARVEALRRKIDKEEALIWQLAGPTMADIRKLKDRRYLCIERWRHAVSNLTPATSEEFVAFGLERAEQYLRMAQKSMAERKGKLSRPVDAQYVAYAIAIMERLEGIPGAKVKGKALKRKYKAVYDWTRVSEWKQE